uniref:Uncharacterized protein n=1 Tax=viral metagenome TaxID=1070528 RepID=A0A6C0H5H5_9ZZZZ
MYWIILQKIINYSIFFWKKIEFFFLFYAYKIYYGRK